MKPFSKQDISLDASTVAIHQHCANTGIQWSENYFETISSISSLKNCLRFAITIATWAQKRYMKILYNNNINWNMKNRWKGKSYRALNRAAQIGKPPFLFTSACALKRRANLEENEKKHECSWRAPGYIGFLFGFLDGWIGGGGVPPAKPLRSYQCGKSPLGSLGGSARFSRDSSVSLYSIPGQ